MMLEQGSKSWNRTVTVALDGQPYPGYSCPGGSAGQRGPGSVGIPCTGTRSYEQCPGSGIAGSSTVTPAVTCKELWYVTRMHQLASDSTHHDPDPLPPLNGREDYDATTVTPGAGRFFFLQVSDAAGRPPRANFKLNLEDCPVTVLARPRPPGPAVVTVTVGRPRARLQVGPGRAPALAANLKLAAAPGRARRRALSHAGGTVPVTQ
eukprot:3738055-Rhodomonas_salina.1